MTSPPFAGQLDRVDARLAAPARETARCVARVMLAMGGTPHIYPGTDRGGCHVEVDEVTVFVDGAGRVAGVVTLEPGDET